ncbi:hypothetical protein BDN72DRAFT_463094 [Pluteus cervinus]|uniref:Uncharacterized protein n=1 Tax=Pluteus cervinus TaxID=181527 RepID=A0ACD3AZZ7_9AGAR|nr:hypothetical protein BDN72DRAFT_463094 [Pluteus cervinus]
MDIQLDGSSGGSTVFYDSFNINIKSEETRMRIKDEVEKLGQTLLQLNRNFATIQRQVDKIDKKAVIVDQDGQVKLYAPRWKKLHRKFTSLMNTSRVVANRVKGCIGTLLHAVIPVLDENYPREAQEASLLGYIKTLERFENEGQDQDNDFSTFRDQIENFRTDLYKAATRRTKEAVIAKAKIDAEIAHLEAKLKVTDGLVCMRSSHRS